jgi:hypothetical protein
MSVYVFDRDRGIMVNRDTRLPMLTEAEMARPLQTPMAIGDLPGYASPIDGSWIEGRRARKYDLEKNNCVDANDLPSPTKGRLKNEAFAKKHGLQHLLGDG